MTLFPIPPLKMLLFTVFCALILFVASHTCCLPLQSRDGDPTILLFPGGSIHGLVAGSGAAHRFTLPTAQPPVGALRFANPQLVQLDQLVSAANGKTFDASALPPACIQGSNGPIGGADKQSEDCLYATFYKPAKARMGDNLPILVWVHGGSGLSGSSTAAGLEGSKLASSQNAIVVFVQYRLGAFGWLQTTATFDEKDPQAGQQSSNKLAGNQAVRDVVTALQQIRNVGQYLGGDVNKVTLMGQSSGAQLVRALLTTPAAEHLFAKAILVSDTQDYGPSTIAQNSFLGDLTMKSLGCDVGDVVCARSKTADQVLDATFSTYSNGPAQDGGVAAGTPWRPVIGTQYIPTALEQNAAAGKGTAKPIIVSTVQNEAGSITAASWKATQPGATTLELAYGNQSVSFGEALDYIFNQARGNAAAVLPQYKYEVEQSDALRRTFEQAATDGLWRCAVQNNVRNLARASSQVWVAEWAVGATYPDNASRNYCVEDGHVCHEDDIFLIFGTMPGSPTPAQETLSREIQTRFGNFARNSIPKGPTGAVDWTPIAADGKNLNMLVMQQGPDGKGLSSIAQSQSPTTCDSDIWGNKILFDWQMYS